MSMVELVAEEADPRPDAVLREVPAALADSAPAPDVQARLSDGAARWVDAGSIRHWVPVYGRSSKPVAVPGGQARYVLTRVAVTPYDAIIRRWLDHQRQLVTAPDTESSALVFARLTVRQRPFAIDVRPSADVKDSIAKLRWLTLRAPFLRVKFGFFVGESIPSWVVCDGDDPMLMGMPQYHLVPVDEPSAGLAALIGGARIKPQVHEVLA